MHCCAKHVTPSSCCLPRHCCTTHASSLCKLLFLSLTLPPNLLPAAIHIRSCLLHHPAFAGEASGPGKGLVAVLADPSLSGHQSQQSGGSGARSAGSDKWPFVVIVPEDKDAVQLVGLSSRWLHRLIGGGDADVGDDDVAPQQGGGVPLPALTRRESAAVTASGGIQRASSSTVVHMPPGVVSGEARAACDNEVDALPLSALLAAVGRLLPLPQLPPKRAAASSGDGGGGGDDPEAREGVLVHLAAVVLLQDAAEQCKVRKDWGAWCRCRVLPEVRACLADGLPRFTLPCCPRFSLSPFPARMQAASLEMV